MKGFLINIIEFFTGFPHIYVNVVLIIITFIQLS